MKRLRDRLERPSLPWPPAGSLAGGADDPYRDLDKLRWELLGDCAFEGEHLVSELLGTVSSHFPERSPDEHRALTARLLGELLAAGHVYLFRRRGDGEEVLRRVEAEQLLAGLGSAGADLSPDTIGVEVAATKAGRRAVEDPPDEIRELWAWPLRL